jgi:hypothetical protein
MARSRWLLFLDKVSELLVAVGMVCILIMVVVVEELKDLLKTRLFRWRDGTNREAIWIPSATFITNSCHLAWGALLTLLLAHWGLRWYAPLVVMAVIVPKELILDVLIESSTVADELTDVCFYALGSCLALIAYSLGG